ncbi:ribonucleoside-diphosphate reductase subunit alpha [Gemmatimonadota bacterium CCK-12]
MNPPPPLQGTLLPQSPTDRSMDGPPDRPLDDRPTHPLAGAVPPHAPPRPTGSTGAPRPHDPPRPSGSAATTPTVIRRSGERVDFDPDRIRVAVTKAFVSVEGEGAAASDRVRSAVASLTEQVVARVADRHHSRPVHVESIQDQVELSLMRDGHHAVARAYVLYREERARRRAAGELRSPDAPRPIRVLDAEGESHFLDHDALARTLDRACAGVADTSPDPLYREVVRSLYDGVTADEIAHAGVMAARTLIEKEPGYSKVAARLLLDSVGATAARHVHGAPIALDYARYFPAYLRLGVTLGHLSPELLTFDIERLAEALDGERDHRFEYLGLQTLVDRYLIHDDGVRYELPQAFFMRVAMGLALQEPDRTARAEEFYHLLSSFRFMSSTPTLFNAGTRRPQLSSCFLTTIPDDLAEIYSGIRDNALLSKYAGGLGNDWTPVRGLGARIRGTNGESQGIVPFLKVANDTAVAVNQGGKRKGAVCAYLEAWHIDVEEFLDLRRNTGDDRRRTHDMHTALWIPDLFMKRVAEGGSWTLFSPDEVPDLHDLTGAAFERRYLDCEARAEAGELRIHRTLPAEDLWRRALSRLFETGHPWITFKDPCNLRSPQEHAGVVHSSNLCTEITLNTTADEVAVCNLGSINLPAHLDPAGDDPSRLDRAALGETVRTAMRMLDNVIDINHYPVPQARRSNLRHRPVGLGIMGFQDALFELRIPYGSEAAVEFADRSMELVSWLAIEASCDLAAERGAYPSFPGSAWSRGVLPIDSIARLEEQRGGWLEQDRSRTLDWDGLRERVRRVGMRNSNTMAIAPTATIANITGVSQSIEPLFANLYVKSNLSGEFTVINPALVRDLKALDLWDEVMVSDLKFHDGSLAPIQRIPDELKALYATAFELDCRWLIEAASRRQKWIDQSQSLNLYVADPDGPLIDNIYKLAWVRGLKTTYYLRSRGATQVEKSTLTTSDGRLNAVAPTLCSLDDDCEACQ